MTAVMRRPGVKPGCLPHHKEVSITSTLRSQEEWGLSGTCFPAPQASSLSCVPHFCPRPSVPTIAVIFTPHSNQVRMSLWPDWSHS